MESVLEDEERISERGSGVTAEDDDVLESGAGGAEFGPLAVFRDVVLPGLDGQPQVDAGGWAGQAGGGRVEGDFDAACCGEVGGIDFELEAQAVGVETGAGCGSGQSVESDLDAPKRSVGGY